MIKLLDYIPQDWEPTKQELEHLSVTAWNYMYEDHAGAAGESMEDLRREHDGIVQVFLWFMKVHNLHFAVE